MASSLIKRLALATTALLGVTTAALAQDNGPLIDKLVRKGILSDQEAEELRADLVKDFAANTSAGKLNMSSSLTEFKLSGDVRLRHQVETQAPSVATGGSLVTNERTRERFRFRLNGDALLQKGWGAGFALESGQASDSGNQTLENGADDYSIFLARAYVSYRPNLNWLFVGGKQKNPFYTTDLNWDADINPQGVSEIYTHFLSGKDTLEIRAGQFQMDDNNEAIAINAAKNTGRDAWLFAQQAVYTKYFGKNSLSSVVLAPGFQLYNQSVLSGLTNENPFNGTTDGLSNVTFAGEVNLANINGDGTSLKFYWDSSYNLEASRRAYRVYGVSRTFDKDPLAWLVGVGYAYGAGKLQGDYSVRLDYRQIGLGSVDVNLNDSDFAFGKLNQEGFKLAASYNLTDFANANLTYFYTTSIQDRLTYTLANLDHSQLLQLDLVVKF